MIRRKDCQLIVTQIPIFSKYVLTVWVQIKEKFLKVIQGELQNDKVWKSRIREHKCKNMNFFTDAVAICQYATEFMVQIKALDFRKKG